jgi:hypothetical protein
MSNSALEQKESLTNSEQVTICHKDGAYHLYCNVSGVVVKDNSLDAAFKNLQTEKLELQRKLQVFGIEPTKIAATSPNVSGNNQKDLRATNSKLGSNTKYIISVALLFFVVTLGYMVYSAITTVQHQINIVAHNIQNPAKITKVVNSTANRLESITDARKQELLHSLRRIVVILKPFVNEVQSLNQPAAQPTVKKDS